jgi:hypothetical protein
MEEDRMPKKIFTQGLERARRMGRPRKGWKVEIERELQVLGVRRWREMVTDRKHGRRLFDRAEVTAGCSANERRRRRRGKEEEEKEEEEEEEEEEERRRKRKRGKKKRRRKRKRRKKKNKRKRKMRRRKKKKIRRGRGRRRKEEEEEEGEKEEEEAIFFFKTIQSPLKTYSIKVQKFWPLEKP